MTMEVAGEDGVEGFDDPRTRQMLREQLAGGGLMLVEMSKRTIPLGIVVVRVEHDFV